ncbi:cyclophilin-like fold protein [Sphingobacterium thalpophilum]|uniref:Uncharacterized conserved protein n=1 Tax=Sphingobacterium thalpophilum TaxID=259 RepID=A0A4U9U9Y6_9SPHI|nr:cyclophilin-like fold protein [Sphingobacterium thalpophilum]VTR29363.1 Uncharacterized conserved protein [Sphingobacterium thalpophilum]
MKIKLIAIILAFVFIAGYAGAQNVSGDSLAKNTEDIKGLQLKITMGKTVATADLVDNPTTKEFIKMLPLTLDMQDVLKTEKYADLKTELPKEGNVIHSYKAGDISYWLGGGIALYYTEDGRPIKAGLIEMAKIKKGFEDFNVPGNVKVIFQIVKSKRN